MCGSSLILVANETLHHRWIEYVYMCYTGNTICGQWWVAVFRTVLAERGHLFLRLMGLHCKVKMGLIPVDTGDTILIFVGNILSGENIQWKDIQIIWYRRLNNAAHSTLAVVDCHFLSLYSKSVHFLFYNTCVFFYLHMSLNLTIGCSGPSNFSRDWPPEKG